MKTLFTITLIFCAALLFGQESYRVRVAVTASSLLPDEKNLYSSTNLIDESWQSWAEGTDGNGVGEYITVRKYASGNNGNENKMTITGFSLKNGYGNPRFYWANNRVKSFKIYADDVFIETIQIKDSAEFEEYTFEKPINATIFKFVIDSVYSGSNYDDTCITELSLKGIDSSGANFHTARSANYDRDTFDDYYIHYSFYNSARGLVLRDSSSGLNQSNQKYPAENLIDVSWNSWAKEGGSGIGEYFSLGWEKREYDETKAEGFIVEGFALKNGYGDPNFYGKNNRVKSFKIYADNTYVETIQVKDSVNFEQYAFSKPLYCDTLKFEIDSIYQGTVYNDTCIEEIALLGEMKSNEEFNRRILADIAYYPGSERGGIYTLYNDPEYGNGVSSIKDIDSELIKKYLPFDIGTNRFGFASEIATLTRPSTLRLTENLPRLDGATAAYPLYSAFVHAVYPEEKLQEDMGYGNYEEEYGISPYSLLQWQYSPVSAFSGGYDMYYSLSEEEEDKMGYRFRSIVQCNRTPNAYQRLIDGKTDIIFCYEPSAEQITAAREKGLRFNLTPIAKDAFVFIVNERNTANTVTQQQIRNIYSGRITNWKTISGADEPIIPYQRNANSGSQTALQTIMGNTKIMEPIMGGAYSYGEMGGSAYAITSDYYNYNSAIGYTFQYYLNEMFSKNYPGIKILSIDGVTPNRQNIQSGAYPFTQTVYAVTTGNKSENTQKFIDWILSPQGQELVEKTGYVPVR
jgi:phosphate transport system substrate-binding protein